MKIAQIVCVYPPYRGGIGKSAEDYTKYLKNRGHQAAVFTPFVNTAQSHQDEDINRLRPFLKFGNAAFLPQLFFKLNKFDIVYLHYPFFGASEIIFLLKFFRRNKFKLVIHYHMDTLELRGLKKLFSLPSTIIRKKLFDLADLIICASFDYIKFSQIKDIYKKNFKKFKELPFSVDTDKFIPNKKIKNTKINITFVGGMDRAHNFKGVDVLLSAFSKIKQLNIKLNLIGNGDLIDGYKQLAKNLDIEDRVNFFTDMSDADKIIKYQNSDIFVLPSINSHEAFGIVLLEAMSCGVPVIASSLPGVRKVFENNQQGLLVIPGDVHDLKNKIEELIFDNEKREKMGILGRDLVKNKYSLKLNNKKLENILLKLLKK